MEVLPFFSQATVSHVLLTACRSTEEAREKDCTYLSASGILQGRRGIFTANLIGTLRAAGKEGLEGLTYSQLMDDLTLRKDQSLPPLLGQNPQCEGAHKNRMLFSMRLVPDMTPAATFELYRDFVLSVCPKGVRIDVRLIHSGDPIVIETDEWISTQMYCGWEWFPAARSAAATSGART